MVDKKLKNEFHFLGNHLCLDFINTRVLEDGRLSDLLENFACLVSWCIAAKIIDPREAGETAKDWDDESEIEQVFEQALSLRSTLRTAVERIIQNKPVPQATVSAINRLLREREGYNEVVRSGDGFEKRFHSAIRKPVHLLAQIAESAADLLSSADPALVKKCESPACIIYFYDTTKNHTRRWCSMKACGNRAKATAFYHRKRQGIGNRSG